MTSLTYCPGTRSSGFGITNTCPMRDHCQRYLEGRGQTEGSWLQTDPFARDDRGQVQCEMFRDGRDER